MDIPSVLVDDRRSPAGPDWHSDGTALPTDPRVSLGRALHMLWRRKGRFALVFLPILLAGFAYLLFAPERYTAHGLLMVGFRQAELGPEQGREPIRNEPDIDGAIELMRTPTALRHVARELQLSARPEISSAGSQSRLPPLRSLRRWVHSLLGQSAATPLPSVGQNPDDPVAVQLRKDIKVERVGRSPLLDVAYSSTDPVLAAAVVNALARYSAEDEGFLARMTLAERAGFQIVKTSVAAAAEPPRDPSSPNAAIILGGSVFCALMAALTAVLLKEFQAQQTILSTEDVAKRGLRVLGLIPDDRAIRHRRGEDVALVANNPGHAFSASITSLHAAVSTLPRLRQDDAPVLLVTSALPAEGKSTTAAALATSMATAGSRVLLIDANLRSPTLHQRFEAEPCPGLAECVDTQASVDRAIRQDAATGVFLLAAGEANARPLRVLGSARLRALIDLWRRQFDVVLIDSPPLLVAGDARVLAQVSDYAIVVTRWEHTNWNALDHALRTLADSGARVAGIAVCRANYRQLASYDHATTQTYAPACGRYLAQRH